MKTATMPYGVKVAHKNLTLVILVRFQLGQLWGSGAVVAHWSYKPVVMGSIPFFPIRRKPWNINKEQIRRNKHGKQRSKNKCNK